MFHLMLTACLAAAPDTCAERLLPTPEPLTEAACAASADARASLWLAAHPGLTPGPTRCAETASLPALPLTDLGDGLWLHSGITAMPAPENGGEIANLGVIIGPQAVAVIDAGATRSEGERLYAAIRQKTGLPITLILTHMHPDHSLGAEVFREAGAKIVASARLGPALEAREETYLTSYTAQLGAEALLGSRFVQPDIKLTSETELTLGPGHTLQLTPVATAHTDNDLTVLHTETNTLFSGDLVFNGLLPTLDGSLTGWLDWLGQDRALRLIPGHGAAPTDWPQGSAATRRYLTALRDSIRAAIAANIPMSAAITRRDEAEAARWVGYDASHPRNASAAYAELEWE